jgi:3-deoxy-7-phosphoheptulonate synthase
MIIILKQKATKKQVQHVLDRVKELGLKPVLSRGVERSVVGVIGEEDILRVQNLEAFPGVEQVMPVQKPYKLVSREFKSEKSHVKVGNVVIGGQKVVVMAGPCTVESRQQLKSTATSVGKSGATILRGGAFKPRTSPYSFQGLGEEGLKLLHEISQACGMPVVTEVMDPRDVVLVEKYADMIQIGARNMQNYTLLKEVGLAQKPVLLKRGLSATINDLLLAAEYIASQGNMDIVLCERGIRTFETSTRFTLDLSAVPVIKELSHLPVVIDPSHSTGKRSLVGIMSKAAIAVGADGLIIEVHPKPEEAKCDGPQALLPKMFADLMRDLKKVSKAVDREI